MPQADSGFAALARGPAVRAAALLWIWLTVVFAPVGATLHAMSHLELPLARAAAPGGIARAARDDPASQFARPRHGGDRHGAAAHCHACDEWQFLDHVLSGVPPRDVSASAARPAAAPLPAVRLTAETPWILPRAPPTRRRSFIA